MSEWERSRRVIKGGQNHSVERERERERKNNKVLENQREVRKRVTDPTLTTAYQTKVEAPLVGSRESSHINKLRAQVKVRE